MTEIQGHADARFEPVRAAFAENFTSRDEHGAAVCLVVEGKTVIDLWGGWADEAATRPWQQDTLVDIFSVGKALVATCAARLVGQGRLDFDDRVSRHWPEFAAEGKDAVTVRQLLSHQAGLPAIRDPLPDEAIYDWGRMCDALATHEPWWPPGEGHGYHVNTLGFLAGEVVRRITGSSMGAWFRDEIAGPLGADVHIGLPVSEHGRVAEFLWPMDPPEAADPGNPVGTDAMTFNTYFNPPGLSGAGTVNTPEWRGAEIPSTNGHGTAGGVARAFEALATGGTVDGVRVVEREPLEEATAEAVYGDDLVLGRPSRFGLAVQLPQPERTFGPSPRAFGHFGAGGSVGFADPDHGVAFAYLMNRMGPRWQNPLNRALIEAVYESLGV